MDSFIFLFFRCLSRQKVVKMTTTVWEDVSVCLSKEVETNTRESEEQKWQKSEWVQKRVRLRQRDELERGGNEGKEKVSVPGEEFRFICSITQPQMIVWV